MVPSQRKDSVRIRLPGPFNDQTGQGGSFTHTTGGNGTVLNDGTYNKSGANTAATFGAGVAFDNNHTVNIAPGACMSVFGGGTSTGTFNIGNNGQLSFLGGAYSLNAGTIMAGFGDAVVDGATVTVNGEVRAHHFFLLPEGTLDGPGNLIITGVFHWLGTMNGPGTTTTRGNTSSIEEGAVLDGRTLENERTMFLDASLEARNNAVINNRGRSWLDSATPSSTAPPLP